MLERIVFLPHPPIVLPQVGGKEAAQAKATRESMQKIAEEIKEINPEVIVAITPHGPVFSDLLTLNGLSVLQGDLADFRAPEVKVEFLPAPEVGAAILRESRQRQLPCTILTEKEYTLFSLKKELDHGLVVPLSFIYNSGWRGKLVPVNIAFLPYATLYAWGKALQVALDSLQLSWVLLVSADLSHRLKEGALAGYAPEGAIFDNLVRQCLGEGNVAGLLQIDPALVEAAGECGLRPIIMALGAVADSVFSVEELSYEGPFGVGYGVARLKIEEEGPVSLARHSIWQYLAQGECGPVPQNVGDLAQKKAGAFVTLYQQGDLRGCMGTIEPTKNSLAKEIMDNAIAAARHDPRFAPVTKAEFAELTISVDILGETEKIDSIEELDPAVYGVIVSSGSRRGLLLPNLEGVDTVEEQVAIARAKAGIVAGEVVELARFKVTRYHE